MSYRLPVLVSDIDGMKEVITDGYNGTTFYNGNSDHLSTQILYLLNNPDTMSNITATAFGYICNAHNWSDIGLATFMLYNKV
jgi:glycosyltransferase involved in cell wall biosynthesis